MQPTRTKAEVLGRKAKVCCDATPRTGDRPAPADNLGTYLPSSRIRTRNSLSESTSPTPRLYASSC